MSKTLNTNDVSFGVQELLTKLQQDGVGKGRSEADKIVAEAESKAEAILKDAEKQAESIINEAKKESHFIQNSGKDSLEIATRNAILELKSYLMDKFSQQIRETISLEMKDENLLQQIILEVAGRSNISQEKHIEVVLPPSVVGIDDLRKHPEKLKHGTLLSFVVEQAQNMLKDGVTFSVGNLEQTGITFCLKDKDIEVVLDDGAVSHMLLEHLQPRFRTLLEGIIH